jgi:hypothetical protein
VRKLYTHDEALELLPWYVNGTLPDTERSGVEGHVRTCLPCRVAMREQYHLAELLKEQPIVPLSADGGFERLLAEIDKRQRPPRSVLGPRASRLARLMTVTALAASLALAAWLVTLGPESSRETTFVTATESASDYVEIDIVFSAQVSEADKHALMREIGEVIAGASDVERYRVRLSERNGDRVDEIVARLRGDSRVRFAARAYSSGQAP